MLVRHKWLVSRLEKSILFQWRQVVARALNQDYTTHSNNLRFRWEATFITREVFRPLKFFTHNKSSIFHVHSCSSHQLSHSHSIFIRQRSNLVNQRSDLGRRLIVFPNLLKESKELHSLNQISPWPQLHFLTTALTLWHKVWHHNQAKVRFTLSYLQIAIGIGKGS